jgi:AmiR/NasT family two-component response regulator
MANQKRILLIDLDDNRRETRVQLLTHAGYAVDVRRDHIEAERLDHEGQFDLVIVTLHGDPGRAAQYSDTLSKAKPRLPVLLLTDLGVYVPPGTRNPSVEAGDPAALIQEVASMLAGSIYVRELPFPAGS